MHILFVTFQAMKRSGHAWPIVSEDLHDRCMQRLTARARFNEGLPGDLANQVVQQFCDEHRERYLLAFVYGYLGEHDLLRSQEVFVTRMGLVGAGADSLKRAMPLVVVDPVIPSGGAQVRWLECW